MLDDKSSSLAHTRQNIVLIWLSILFLPLDTFILFTSYAIRSMLHSPVDEKRKAIRQTLGFRPRTILVTGVGMTKGLALARLFYQAGHDVIGADFEPNGALVCGRASKVLTRFHRLEKPTASAGSAPYVQGLLDVILKEKVNLWVSCSGVASAVEDGEAKEIVEKRTKCRAIQFNVENTQTLHEKHTFIEHTREIGLNVPETHTATSRSAVEETLRNAPAGRKYIMKTIGMDDASRGNMTLLPKASLEETSRYISRLNISERFPWIVQQFVEGKEYCTHSLVIRGQVKAFVACPSLELLMHYEALPSQSPLNQAMLRFTQAYAKNGGDTFTGHLSFDFLVEDDKLDDPDKIVLYPIECNPRAHTAVALFNSTPSMVDGYLSLLDEGKKDNDRRASMIITPFQPDKYYWVGHDLITLVLLPCLSFALLQASPLQVIRDFRRFLEHLVFWKDGTYELWDPLPWWWLYHVYWPMQFLNCLRSGKRWSRINVSTTKMFEC